VTKVPVRSSGLTESLPQPKIEVEGREVPGRGEYFIDVTPMRHAIASRTRQSATEIPHAWTMIEADVTNLVLLRNKVKDEFMRREGINLTYLAFVLKAVVNAIKDYPIMNSVWAVDKIIVKRDINISLLVGTEDFVTAPVIKKADEKTIAGLAREIDDLTKRARAGKLTYNDLEGGTFTVNNTGAFGSILSYPIINYPQAAILTFESIVKKTGRHSGHDRRPLDGQPLPVARSPHSRRRHLRPLPAAGERKSGKLQSGHETILTAAYTLI